MVYQQEIGPVVAAYIVGFGMVYAHGLVGWLFWRQKLGDPIQMIAWTVLPPPGTPFWQHLVMWPLHKMKYIGLLLIAGGVYGTVGWIYEHITGRPF